MPEYSLVGARFHDDRDELIAEFCSGRRVLHVGAADWPYTQEKFLSGTLLHARISEVASDCLGIDLDAGSVAWLRQHAELAPIRVIDLDLVTELEFEADVVVFGETIEHLVNLRNVLNSLKRCMSQTTDLLISTPNLAYANVAWMNLRQKDFVHPDHKVGFTYPLLYQLLEAEGFEVVEGAFTFLPRATSLNMKERALRRLAKARPGLSETLLFRARLGSDTSD